MNHRDHQKPYYIPSDKLVPTKSGWCDTRNHNEVIIAYPHVDTLVAEDLVNLVASISLPATFAVHVGETLPLTATILPVTAVNQGVTWSTSDATIATVDSTGQVTGVAAGTATITAVTHDGGFVATSTVTVSVPV
jgi:uncharacterized protein YjdB